MNCRTRLVVIVAALVIGNVSALAAAGDTTIHSAEWTWPWYITLPLLAAALLYVMGSWRIRRRNSRIHVLPIAFFAAGWLSLLLALDSPIHEISEQLFWVHMTQHEILMVISAPLLVLSQPAASLLFALPDKWRVQVGAIARVNILRRSWLAISSPLAAWLLHAVALWIWHAPTLFVAALQNELAHAAQHISFLGTALLFWWTLFHNHAGRLGYGGAILYLFTTAIHTGVLGAWLTFSGQVWYAPYSQTAPLWHLTAIEDQQLGGLIMWIPAGTLLTIAALVLLGKWIRHSDDRWKFTQAAAVIRASGES